MTYNILVINPGSTSTKVAYYENEKELFSKTLQHTLDELSKYPGKEEQMDYRKSLILKELENANIDIKNMSAVACRGGTFGGLKGGAYLVDDALIEMCMLPDSRHASNWAAVIGKSIADEYSVKAYIYDAVGADETTKIAHYTGIKGLMRENRTHTLNTRAVCKQTARELGKAYTDMNFIVAHMGGGLSINVHEKGRIVDTLATDDGPMSTERAGILSTLRVTEMCFSGKYTQKEIDQLLMGKGGLVSHFGTNDVREVEKMIDDGDEYAKEVFEFWGYQISKFIGSLATVVEGDVDRIVITGGAAHSARLINLIAERVKFIAPVKVIPGALEMEALASGILSVLKGEEAVNYYGK